MDPNHYRLSSKHSDRYPTAVNSVAKACLIVRYHSWLVGLSIIYIASALILLALIPAGRALATPSLAKLWFNTTSLMLLGLCLGLLLDIVLLRHPRRPLLVLWQDIRKILTFEHLFSAFLILFLLSPSLYYFMSIKSMIPFINHHFFDIEFYQIDRWLFMGHVPQTILKPLITPAWRYQTYSTVYSAGWAGVTLSVTGYVIFRSPEGLRKSRYLLSYLLNFILLGNIFAIALNSGGPLFFHQYTGLTAYDAFVHHLQLMSGQKEWTSYALSKTLGGNPEDGIPAPPGLGISAMPSLHVATSLIILLHAWQCGLARRLLASIYFIIMAIGSIALGWHYAIDGIVASALGLCIWSGAGWLTRRQAAFNPDRQLGTII